MADTVQVTAWGTDGATAPVYLPLTGRDDDRFIHRILPVLPGQRLLLGGLPPLPEAPPVRRPDQPVIINPGAVAYPVYQQLLSMTIAAQDAADFANCVGLAAVIVPAALGTTRITDHAALHSLGVTPIALWVVPISDDQPRFTHTACEQPLEAHDMRALFARSTTTGVADGALLARLAARAISLVQTARRQRHHALTGEVLTWDEYGNAGHIEQGREEYPRINPVVIGLVFHPDGDKVLLARHRHRDAYYSAVAGYVEQGETLEDAFAREVFEETSLPVTHVTYVTSQSWPRSSSLMLGMTCVAAADIEPYPLDGEIGELKWVTRQELIDETVPLAARGSVARWLLDLFADGHLTSPAHTRG